MSTNRFEVVESSPALKVERCKKFSFVGFSPGIESFCHLVLATRNDGKTTVVCSQPDSYVGTSVTNAVEIIYRDLLGIRGRRFQLAHWLEHYPPGAGMLQERYSLMEVTFNSSSPSWGPLTNWADAAKRVRVPMRLLAYGYDQEIH